MEASAVSPSSEPIVTSIDIYREKLEKNYPNLYAALMSQDSQKSMMRAIDELMVKDEHTRRIAEAEKDLEAKNEAVYAALKAVDYYRSRLEDVRMKAREVEYSLLPF